MLLGLSYSISQGRRVALATVAGVATGDFIAMGASLGGLKDLVLASVALFTAVKWIGVIYLIYLGIKLFRSASQVSFEDVEQVPKARVSSVFAHAAAVTALNPTSIAFFIAFVPLFVALERPLLPQFSILIGTFVGLAALNSLAYAPLADPLKTHIACPTVLAHIPRLGGGALVAVGFSTALTRRVQG